MSGDASRDALVVGINTYKYPRLKPLKTPSENAESIAQLLMKYGGFRVKRIPEAVLKDGSMRVGRQMEVTLKHLRKAIEQLFMPEGGNSPETALLFFSGHGLRDDSRIKKGYLAASDVNPDDEKWGLSLPWLRELLEKSPIKQQIVWLDCCYSGELFNFDDNLQEADPGNKEGYDRNFITASRGFEIAYENTSGTHGVLTTALLKGLDPSLRPDGWVTSHTLADFINQELKIETQRPLCHNSGNLIILTTNVPTKPVDPSVTSICPYKGLEYFTQKDAGFFYGRTALTDELIEQIRQDNFIAILGASGSGKSSVLRAGLLYELKLGRRITGSERWQIYEPFTPGEHPLQSLEVAIGKTANELEQLITNTESDRILLIVDQFEECFTLCEDNKERQLFFDYLLAAVEQTNNKLCLILGMRADFLGKCAEYAGLANKIDKHLVTIKPMNDDELNQAIVKPAEQVGLQVQSQLVTRIIEDVKDSPGSLPLLQYTLTELWKQRQEPFRNWLTLFSYEQLGGVKETLENRANEVYQSLSSDEQPVAQRIFLELTQLGDVAKTRRRVRRQDLVNKQHSEALLNRVIQKLIKARLIITDDDESKSQQGVLDIAHEALIRYWGQLGEWVKKYQVPMEIEHRIEADAREWEKRDKPPGLLLQDDRLVEAEDYLKEYRHLGFLDGIAEEFIEASKKVRARHKIWRTILGVVVPASMVSAIALWWWAGFQEKTAKSLRLANASETNLNIDTTRSLWLAIAAKLTQDTPQADLALWDALQANHERLQLLGHQKKINYAEFFPGDSKRVLTVSEDRTARIWNLDAPSNPIILKGHGGNVKHGCFDPQNPDRVLTVSYDGIARIWDLKNPHQPIITLTKHKGPIYYGSFDPKNSNRVLTVGSDRTAFVWNLNDPENPLALQGHEGEVWMGVFEPQNSNRVLTVSQDRTARIWDLSKPQQPLFTLKHQDQVLYASFDPKNSNRVLTVSSDRTAIVWNLSNPSQPEQVLKGHDGTILYGTFDPNDSNKVLTVSEDGTARVWNLNNPSQTQILRGHQGGVLGGVFNPENSNQVLTVGADGTAKIWDIQNSTIIFTLQSHSQAVVWGTFDPANSSRILTVSNDSTARIWDVNNETSIQLPSRRDPDISGVVSSIFTPGNTNRVLTLQRDGTVKDWKLDDPKHVKTLPIKLGSIEDGIFAPSNPNIIATISSNGRRLLVWHLQHPGQPLELPVGEKKINEIRFDPKNSNRLFRINSNSTATVLDISGKNKPIELPSLKLIGEAAFNPNDPDRVATASVDGKVRIWSLKKPTKPLKEFSANQQVWHISFDPKNSNRILIGGGDGIARVWDIGNLSIITELSGHETAIAYGSFDPNNPNRLLTVSQDGTTRLWDLRIPNTPLILKGHTGAVKYGIFDFQNSNRVLTVGVDGKAIIYTIGSKNMLQLALNNSSRCLTEQEISNYELLRIDILKLLFDYLQKPNQLIESQKFKPYCKPNILKKYEKITNSTAAIFSR